MQTQKHIHYSTMCLNHTQTYTCTRIHHTTCLWCSPTHIHYSTLCQFTHTYKRITLNTVLDLCTHTHLHIYTVYYVTLIHKHILFPFWLFHVCIHTHTRASNYCLIHTHHLLMCLITLLHMHILCTTVYLIYMLLPTYQHIYIYLH